MFLKELERQEESIYASEMKEMIYRTIDSGGISKLDNKEFKGLYIKKIYNDHGMGKNGRQVSMQNSFTANASVYKSVVQTERNNSQMERGK